MLFLHCLYCLYLLIQYLLSAFVAALATLSATISRLLILSTGVMVFVLSPFINPLLLFLPFCVPFEVLSALWLAFEAVRKYSFADFLSFAFCNAFSHLCFKNLFLSIFIVYIFAVLLFLAFIFFALFPNTLISFLSVFFISSTS